MQKTLPATLAISPSTFNYVSGTGVTLSHLFSGWDPQKIANLHASTEPHDTAVCQKFYYMHSEIQSAWQKKSNSSPQQKTATQDAPTAGWKKWLAGNSGLPKKFVATQGLYRWLDEFKPEIIYTTLGTIPFMQAILCIRDRYRTKLVIHHMDDWYQDAYSTGIFRYQRREMLRLFHDILEKADLRLTIGEKMAEEYKGRFGFEFFPFQNTVDVKQFHESVIGARSIPETPTLLYFGSIFSYAQEDSLLDLANLANSQRDKKFQLRIIAPAAHLAQFRHKLQNESGIEFREITNDKNQFHREIAQSTALLLPANFDDKTVNSLWLSMPTKLPGYLASGVPIIAYGNARLAQTIYTKKYNAACVVDERDNSLLKKSILDLIYSKDKQKKLSDAALALAYEKHDSDKVREDFQRMLYSLQGEK